MPRLRHLEQDMPEIIPEPIELTDDELEAVSGGAAGGNGGNGTGGAGGFTNFFMGANFGGGAGGAGTGGAGGNGA
jgi:bacteriocin-like protein